MIELRLDGHAHLDAMRRRDQAAAAVQLEIERVLQLDRDARLGRAVRRIDALDLDLRERGAERRLAADTSVTRRAAGSTRR